MEVTAPIRWKAEGYRTRLCGRSPPERGPDNARYSAMGRLARALRFLQQVNSSADERGRRFQSPFSRAERISAVGDVGYRESAVTNTRQVPQLPRSAAQRCERSGAQRGATVHFPGRND